MKGVTIITASAGSGKTTRLSQELEQAVRGGVRPQAVLATTFTRKAAAELKERARRALLESGQPEAAHHLLAARIGTVHAVCSELVAEFSLELGLSPELGVIDEVVADHTLERAISSAVPRAIQEELAELEQRMPKLEWVSAVRSLIASARENQIPSSAFQACAQRSIEAYRELFAPPAAAAESEALDRELQGALQAFLRDPRVADDGTKTTQAYADRARRVLAQLKSGIRPAWAEWVGLSRGPGARSREAAEPLCRAAAAHDVHPQLRADIERAIELVYDAAAWSFEAYQARKQSWGVLDFVDQEVYARELLKSPSIRSRLREEIDLVLVDEFQDTSPLQLAIFLELTQIAPRSIWVGDPKQAIYGFRGTDPALMTAATTELAGAPDPEFLGRAVSALAGSGNWDSLGTSYRSRPELVSLTSDVFAEAFQSQGIGPDRVRLEPSLKEEPEGLGPIVETWTLGGKKVDEHAASLASAIRELVGEPIHVREGDSSGARPARPGDLAVLCRTNEQCAKVAEALAHLDLRAALPRAGLTFTPEGRVALAALRLWIDPRDRLAAATLSRFVDYPEDGDAWLEEMLATAQDEGPAPEACVAVRALWRERERAASAGVVEAFDRAIDAVGLPALCRGWGEAEARLGNLDALRAHAVTYVAASRARAAPPTLIGFLAHLSELADDSMGKRPQDSQAVNTREDAVVVSTWHGAKGLEWPVTILFGLDSYPERDALGLSIQSDRSDIDLADPLAGRWLRFWPNPYRSVPRGTTFADRLEAHEETERARAVADREALRLLYVCWTRARDRLIFAAPKGKLVGGLLGKLQNLGAHLFEVPGENGRATWAGHPVAARVRNPVPAEAVPPSSEPGFAYPARERREHPPAIITASTFADPGVAGEPIRLGERVPLSGDPDMTHIGQALHAFFAADRHPSSRPNRRELAAHLLERWRVSSHLAPEALLDAGDALARWIAETWPDAHTYAEWPIRERLPEGTELRGVADLVAETRCGVVVIDHKTFPGTLQDALRRAGQHAGQLFAYGNAIARALESPLAATFIHLPIGGVVVPVATESDRDAADFSKATRPEPAPSS